MTHIVSAIDQCVATLCIIAIYHRYNGAVSVRMVALMAVALRQFSSVTVTVVMAV